MNHRQRRTAGAGAGLASLMMVGVLIFNSIPAAAVDFANPAFKKVWDRTDSLVASLQVSRTWFWGPEPKAAAQEQYVDAPNGLGTRLVQYFDKSRMEINDPAANPNSPWYVTNGLLTIELISGQMQIGNNAFVNRYPANLPISGDSDDVNAPTYATFGAVSNTRKGDHPQADRRGQYATWTINKAAHVGDDQTKTSVPGTKITYYEPMTRHNIPDIFWQFLNASGPISDSGKIVNARLIDPWFYASGLPISDPYWANVKIQGAVTPVMIQAYERRVLTYVPTNVPGFQVEMGNVGLTYYDWRYKDAGKATGTVTPGASTPTTTPPGSPVVGTPTATGTPGSPTVTVTGTPPTSTPTITATPNVITQGYIAFASNRTGTYHIFVIKGDGTNSKDLTAGSPFNNDYPAWSPDGTKLAFVTNRDGNNEIYVMNSDGSGLTRLTNDPNDDTQPAWSPDGTQIVFASKRAGGQYDLYVMNANGSDPHNITLTPADDTGPAWASNGRIAFSSKRTGTAQIYTANSDGSGLTGPITTDGENLLPKWNSVAKRITFVSTRNGNHEIYTMRPGGEEQTRLTNTPGFDNWDPAYAPDDSRIVFTSNRIDINNFELYTMSIDGSNQERITIQTGQDVHPSWKVQP